MKTQKRMKKNQGFTLVELIVVLVILAILAAILVPALLGYIDRAKGQQVVLNAKACLTAAQAEMSSLYATAKDTSKPMTSMPSASSTRILNTADVPADNLVIGVKEGGKHDNFTVVYVKYVEGDSTLYLDPATKQWIEDAPSTDGIKQYTIKSN